MKAIRQGKTIDRPQKGTSQPMIPPSPRGHVAFSALRAMNGIRAILRDVFAAARNGHRSRIRPEARLAIELAAVVPVGPKARKP